jgi:hypothetical protein
MEPNTGAAPALTAIVLAPLVGWAAMGVCWLVVSTDNRGGVDYGVMLIGAAVAAVLTAVRRDRALMVKPSTVAWSLVAFFITFAVSFAVVYPLWLASGFDAID